MSVFLLFHVLLVISWFLVINLAHSFRWVDGKGVHTSWILFTLTLLLWAV